MLRSELIEKIENLQSEKERISTSLSPSPPMMDFSAGDRPNPNYENGINRVNQIDSEILRLAEIAKTIPREESKELSLKREDLLRVIEQNSILVNDYRQQLADTTDQNMNILLGNKVNQLQTDIRDKQLILDIL